MLAVSGARHEICVLRMFHGGVGFGVMRRRLPAVAGRCANGRRMGCWAACCLNMREAHVWRAFFAVQAGVQAAGGFFWGCFMRVTHFLAQGCLAALAGRDV